MSTNFAEIKGHQCADCGEMYQDIDLDRMDSQGCYGLSIKADTGYIDFSPQMIAELVDALVRYQNE